MRKIVVVSALVVALWAPHASAVPLPLDAAMFLYILGVPPTIGWDGAGTAVVNGSAAMSPVAEIAIAPGQIATTGNVVQVDRPYALPIGGLKVTASNGPAAFAQGGAPDGGFGGTMPLFGTMKVCLFGDCSAAVANLEVPLSVIGRGGMVAASGAVNISVVGAPWTTGTVFVGSLTPQRGHLVTSPSRWVAATLVTPVFISTNITTSPVFPAFASLGFVLWTPEPATAVLLIAGFCGLTAYRRSRTGAERQ